MLTSAFLPPTFGERIGEEAASKRSQGAVKMGWKGEGRLGEVK